MKISNKKLVDVIVEETLAVTQEQKLLQESNVGFATWLARRFGKGVTHGRSGWRLARAMLGAPEIGKAKHIGAVLRTGLELLDNAVHQQLRLNLRSTGDIGTRLTDFRKKIANVLLKMDNKFLRTWKNIKYDEFRKLADQASDEALHLLKEFQGEGGYIDVAKQGLENAKRWRAQPGVDAGSARRAVQNYTKALKDAESIEKKLMQLRTLIQKGEPEEVFVALHKTRSTDDVVSKALYNRAHVSRRARKQYAKKNPEGIQTLYGKTIGGIPYLGSLPKRLLQTWIALNVAIHAAHFVSEKWLMDWAKKLDEPWRSEVIRMIRLGMINHVILQLIDWGLEKAMAIVGFGVDLMNAGPDEVETNQTVELFVNQGILLKLLSRGDYKPNFYKDQYRIYKKGYIKLFRGWKDTNKGEFESRGGFNAWLADRVAFYADQVIEKSNNIEEDLADPRKKIRRSKEIRDTAFLYYLALNVERRYGIKINTKDVSFEVVRDKIKNNLDKIPRADRQHYKIWIDTGGREPWSPALKTKLLFNVPAIKKDIQAAAEITKRDLVDMAQNL